MLVGGAVAAQEESVSTNALKDYVSKPDESYAWKTHARYRQGGTEVLELRLYSQTWRNVVWKVLGYFRLVGVPPPTSGNEQESVALCFYPPRFDDVELMLPEDVAPRLRIQS